MDGAKTVYFLEKKNKKLMEAAMSNSGNQQSPRICITFLIYQKVECKEEIKQDTLPNARVTGFFSSFWKGIQNKGSVLED